MDPEANKAIARRYFSEMVDQRSDKLIEELWTEDCVVHRPEVSGSVKGREAFRQAFNRVVGLHSEFKTTIHDLVAENDRVVCHLSHRVVHRAAERGRAGSVPMRWLWAKWSLGLRLQCSAFARGKSLRSGFAGTSSGCSCNSVW